MEGQGDLISRLARGITRVAIRVLGDVENLDLLGAHMV